LLGGVADRERLKDLRRQLNNSAQPVKLPLNKKQQVMVYSLLEEYSRRSDRRIPFAWSNLSENGARRPNAADGGDDNTSTMDLLSLPAAEAGAFYKQLNQDIDNLRQKVDRQLRDMIAASQEEVKVLHSGLNELKIMDNPTFSTPHQDSRDRGGLVPSSQPPAVSPPPASPSLLSRTRDCPFEQSLPPSDSNVTQPIGNLSRKKGYRDFNSLSPTMEAQLIGIVRQEPLVEEGEDDDDEASGVDIPKGGRSSRAYSSNHHLGRSSNRRSERNSDMSGTESSTRLNPLPRHYTNSVPRDRHHRDSDGDDEKEAPSGIGGMVKEPIPNNLSERIEKLSQISKKFFPEEFKEREASHDDDEDYETSGKTSLSATFFPPSVIEVNHDAALGLSLDTDEYDSAKPSRTSESSIDPPEKGRRFRKPGSQSRSQSRSRSKSKSRSKTRSPPRSQSRATSRRSGSPSRSKSPTRLRPPKGAISKGASTSQKGDSPRRRSGTLDSMPLNTLESMQRRPSPVRADRGPTPERTRRNNKPAGRANHFSGLDANGRRPSPERMLSERSISRGKSTVDGSKSSTRKRTESSVVKNKESETKTFSRHSDFKRPEPQKVSPSPSVLKKSTHEKQQNRPIEGGYDSDKLTSKYSRKEFDYNKSSRPKEKEDSEIKTGRQTPGEHCLTMSAPKRLYSTHQHRDNDRPDTADRNERRKDAHDLSPTSFSSNDLNHVPTQSSDGELMLLTRVDVEKEPASELLLFTPVGSSKGQLMKVEHVRTQSDHSEGHLVRIKPVNIERTIETKHKATGGGVPAKLQLLAPEEDQNETHAKKKAASKHNETHSSKNVAPIVVMQPHQKMKQGLPSLLDSDSGTSAHVAAAAGSEAATHAAAMAAEGTHQVQQVENSAGHVVLVRQVQNMMIRDPYGDEGRYTGVVMDGRPHGRGTMHYIDGRSYAGDWKLGRWCGQGRATFVNGDIYVGQYERDQRHGYGRYEWADGRVYDGGFRRDNRNGSGTYSWPDGSSYTGEFLNGHRHGQGTYQFADGSIYTGEWKNGKYHGHGECVWADGRTYRGDWQEGKAHGYGVEHRPDGSIRHEGEWKKDRPVRPKLEP
jgi:hypothetical protein